MKNVLWWIALCGSWVACGVGVTALGNWQFAAHRPLWSGAVLGVLTFGGMTLLRYAEHRGWVRPLLGDNQELRRRAGELAAERERILAEARQRSKP